MSFGRDKTKRDGSPPLPPIPSFFSFSFFLSHSERETAAFTVKNIIPWNEHRGPTVPQPFHFATSERGHEDDDNVAEKPDSRPLAQRALLERLLEEDSGINDTLFGGANIDITRM